MKLQGLPFFQCYKMLKIDLQGLTKGVNTDTYYQTKIVQCLKKVTSSSIGVKLGSSKYESHNKFQEL